MKVRSSLFPAPVHSILLLRFIRSLDSVVS